jgi:hypothetical protein
VDVGICLHADLLRAVHPYHTAIPIIIEGHETASNDFKYQFTTGKPLKYLKPTLNYYENGSTEKRAPLPEKSLQTTHKFAYMYVLFCAIHARHTYRVSLATQRLPGLHIANYLSLLFQHQLGCGRARECFAHTSDSVMDGSELSG